MSILKRLMGMLLSDSSDLVVSIPDEIKTKVNFVQGDFPSQVGVQPAPAVEGDFCDTNPRSMVNAGQGGLVAGPNGARVGRWCWWNQASIDNDNAPSYVSNVNGSGPPTGFCFRNQQALITTYLASSGMVIPAGFPVTLAKIAGVWVKNANASGNAEIGQYAFAVFADGSTVFGAGGTVGTTGINALSATGSIGAGSTTFTGAISGNILTVSGTLGGNAVVPVGASLSGGTGVISGTTIVAQLSGGTVGGLGTYALNYPQQSVSAAQLTATFGILNITAVVAGTLSIGDLLTGTNALTANTTITALGTGTGNTGTYYVNNSQTVGSQTLTVQTNIQTKWVAMSSGKPGELIKISADLLG